jgi:hypothetical protein
MTLQWCYKLWRHFYDHHDDCNMFKVQAAERFKKFYSTGHRPPLTPKSHLPWGASNPKGLQGSSLEGSLKLPVFYGLHPYTWCVISSTLNCPRWSNGATTLVRTALIITVYHLCPWHSILLTVVLHIDVVVNVVAPTLLYHFYNKTLMRHQLGAILP